jgi:hypothetical protein
VGQGTMIDELVAFISGERGQFETQHNNMVAFAFGEIGRYRRFLEVIVGRHEDLAARLVALHKEHMAALQPGTHPMDERETREMEERERLTMEWQLEIESAYLFAKILLDKVARSIEFYFGPVQRCSLDSHDDLVKRIGTYASAIKLNLPQQFVPMAQLLKKDVSDFRDYQIAHEKSPRTIRAMSYDPAGATRLIMTQLYPTPKDKQRLGRSPLDLLADIDAYLRQFMALIQTNRERSRLRRDVSPARRPDSKPR